MSNAKKLGLWTLVMLTFVPTFGFGNITTNAVALGPAAIPSWLLVSLLFFFPLSIMIAELASKNQDKEGGLYTWIESALGPKWAFIGTWSYFVANLFYLQMVFARIPVSVSWAIFGENRFNDQNAYLLPYLSIILAIILTYVATKGVKKFSKLADFGGKFTLAATIIFIVFAFIGLLIGKPSATQFTVDNTIPKFDTSYFATFSWLLFAVAGAEVAGTYIKDVDDPQRTFPKAVLIATILIALAYVVGSIAVCLVISPEALQEANLKNAGYVVYKTLAENFGINGKIVVQIYAAILTITSIAAYIVWIESPIRAMFAEVPEGTFPKFLTEKDENGTLKKALWTQCAIVIIMIAVPLLGLNSIDAFFRLLTDLSALSLVVPYIILIAAYISFRLKNQDVPFKFFKSNTTAMIFSWIALILSIAGFFGAGLDYISGAESSKEALIQIIKTYGGPVILIILGYIITFLTKAVNKNIEKTETM
ncbi:amino acid/polyamine/organocation transporter, APC superfamily (TC 2.A.3) [Caloramator fervidus]|uniref:Amino acid/polyamine/organocation transporter, APC superfamily (TC 2.A.3) n=1 Tax=Caloramator fervidus TaxID=29344 RepID=A0A1H5WXK5_9CLOT|nr:amino acid permease [Caloramator fervidus]SEG03890.1 amino acid/polyamine/organocation transporter, APC superfamily (TC 2.A.3) [Caloramator fervidus]